MCIRDSLPLLRYPAPLAHPITPPSACPPVAPPFLYANGPWRSGVLFTASAIVFVLSLSLLILVFSRPSLHPSSSPPSPRPPRARQAVYLTSKGVLRMAQG
eukprot:2658936-Pyramimonas_sp.AAC.1